MRVLFKDPGEKIRGIYTAQLISSNGHLGTRCDFVDFYSSAKWLASQTIRVLQAHSRSRHSLVQGGRCTAACGCATKMRVACRNREVSVDTEQCCEVRRSRLQRELGCRGVRRWTVGWCTGGKWRSSVVERGSRRGGRTQEKVCVGGRMGDGEVRDAAVGVDLGSFCAGAAV